MGRGKGTLTLATDKGQLERDTDRNLYISTEICTSLQIEGLLKPVSTGDAYCFRGVQRAYDYHTDLARKHRRAPLKSPEVS